MSDQREPDIAALEKEFGVYPKAKGKAEDVLKAAHESHPMTAPFDQPLSKCCHAPMQVYCADEGTQCHVCTKCSRPTDAVGDGVAEPDQPAPDVEAVRGRVEANDYFGNPSTLVDMKKLLAAIEHRDRRIEEMERQLAEARKVAADAQ